jgi:hypothetical protein
MDVISQLLNALPVSERRCRLLNGAAWSVAIATQ